MNTTHPDYVVITKTSDYQYTYIGYPNNGMTVLAEFFLNPYYCDADHLDYTLHDYSDSPDSESPGVDLRRRGSDVILFLNEEHHGPYPYSFVLPIPSFVEMVRQGFIIFFKRHAENVRISRNGDTISFEILDTGEIIVAMPPTTSQRLSKEEFDKRYPTTRYTLSRPEEGKKPSSDHNKEWVNNLPAPVKRWLTPKTAKTIPPVCAPCVKNSEAGLRTPFPCLLGAFTSIHPGISAAKNLLADTAYPSLNTVSKTAIYASRWHLDLFDCLNKAKQWQLTPDQVFIIESRLGLTGSKKLTLRQWHLHHISNWKTSAFFPTGWAIERMVKEAISALENCSSDHSIKRRNLCVVRGRSSSGYLFEFSLSSNGEIIALCPVIEESA